MLLNNTQIKEIEKFIGYKFKNKELLIQALTHSSMKNENNYEKLEFLGDSFLSIVVSNYIFNKHSNLNVGEMSRLRSNMVSTTALYNVVINNGIENFIIMGESVKNNATSIKNICADVFESIIASIFVDGGEKNAVKFINKFILNNNLIGLTSADYKTQLQELIQSKFKGTIIEYQEIGETGPMHNLTFEMGVFLNGELQEIAKGKTKKEAEQLCAKKLVEKLLK